MYRIEEEKEEEIVASWKGGLGGEVLVAYHSLARGGASSVCLFFSFLILHRFFFFVLSLSIKPTFFWSVPNL